EQIGDGPLPLRNREHGEVLHPPEDKRGGFDRRWTPLDELTRESSVFVLQHLECAEGLGIRPGAPQEPPQAGALHLIPALVNVGDRQAPVVPHGHCPPLRPSSLGDAIRLILPPLDYGLSGGKPCPAGLSPIPP